MLLLRFVVVAQCDAVDMHASEEHARQHRREKSKVLAHVLAEFDLCNLFVGNHQWCWRFKAKTISRGNYRRSRIRGDLCGSRFVDSLTGLLRVKRKGSYCK